MLDKNQIYVIVDIETDGPVPGLHSILSVGAVSSTQTKEEGEFYQKLLPIEGASRDPDTMQWWSQRPDSWQEATAGAQPAGKVITNFHKWITNLGNAPIFVASPLAFDYSFIHWYLYRFIGTNPFEDYTGVQRTLDLASFTSGKLNIPLSHARRPQLVNRFKEGMPEHSHKAIDDARGYGVILRNILNTNA